MITWGEKETLEAAEAASRLSELLEHEGFFEEDALHWLEHRHIEKFLSAIDGEESTKLEYLAASWHYPANDGETDSFPLLDWLLVVGPKYDFERERLKTSAGPGLGRKLVVRLAYLKPDWVGRWWKWRCSNGNGLKQYWGPVGTAVVNALSSNDLHIRLLALADITVAGIVAERPELMEVLPRERRGAVLQRSLGSASDKGISFSGLVDEIIKLGIPSDPIAVIDGVLGSSQQSEAVDRCDELVAKYSSNSVPDPVTFAMSRGHDRLEALFRSIWQAIPRSLGSRGGDNTWDHPLKWGHIGHSLASAVSVAPERFRLELGFSIGVRIAEEEGEVSPEAVKSTVQQDGYQSFVRNGPHAAFNG